MNVMEIKIIVEPVTNIPFQIIEEGKNVLYVDSYQQPHFISEKAALELIDRYGNECTSVMLGKTDFIVAFPSASKIIVDGEALLLGEFVVMKSEYGLKPLSLDEMEQVVGEMESRAVTLVAGNQRIVAIAI